MLVGALTRARGTMANYVDAWRLRLEALTSLLGPADSTVLTSARPLYLGGSADVMTFRQFGPGLTYVTGGLTGVAGIDQKPAATGRNYELMICTPREEPWAATLVSRLARYTLDATLNPGETMDCPIFPGSRLNALLFASPDLKTPFVFGGHEYELRLCIGITPRELEACRATGSAEVLDDLRARNVFPWTDTGRS
jgi:Suppressor of fused protein (SUFU)